MSAAALEIEPLTGLFKALADETRVRIVSLLAHGELCVCHLVGALGLPQSTVSRQLGILRHAGIVSARREGTWIYYRLAKPASASCSAQLASLIKTFGKDARQKADVERLLRTRGPGQCG